MRKLSPSSSGELVLCAHTPFALESAFAEMSVNEHRCAMAEQGQLQVLPDTHECAGSSSLAS